MLLHFAGSLGAKPRDGVTRRCDLLVGSWATVAGTIYEGYMERMRMDTNCRAVSITFPPALFIESECDPPPLLTIKGARC